MERMDNKRWHGGKVGLCLCGAALLCAACLDEVNTVYNPGDTPAVTRRAADGNMVADTRYGTVYDSRLGSNNSGTCLLLDFTYHADDPAQMDTAATGYYQVYLQNQVAVNQQELQTPLTATGSLLPNELPIEYAVSDYAGNRRYIAFIGGYLFLPTQYRSGVGQSVRWELSYDPEAGMEETGGVRAYPLYLRAHATAPREAGVQDTSLVVLNAFHLAPLLQQAATGGEGASRELYVAIHYITNIDAADSSRFVWTVADPLQIQ